MADSAVAVANATLDSGEAATVGWRFDAERAEPDGILTPSAESAADELAAAADSVEH